MKSQCCLALFLVFVLRSASLKLQSTKENLNCDPHGTSNVPPTVNTVNTEQKLYNVPAIDIGANNGKAFICGADGKIYELIQDQNYYLPFAGVAPSEQCQRITVDIKGNHWISNRSIYRYKNDVNQWEIVLQAGVGVLDISCSKLSDCYFVRSSNYDVLRISSSDLKIINEGIQSIGSIDASATKVCIYHWSRRIYCKKYGEEWVDTGRGGIISDITVCKNDDIYSFVDGYIFRLSAANVWQDIGYFKDTISRMACDKKLWYLNSRIAYN